MNTMVMYIIAAANIAVVVLMERALRRRVNVEKAMKEAAESEKKFWEMMARLNLEAQLQGGGEIHLPNRTKAREQVN